MLAASVYIVYISQLVHVYAILGHVPNADTLWKELRRHIGHTIQWSKKNKTQKTEKTSSMDTTKQQVLLKSCL
jgi:hypothetical protein